MNYAANKWMRSRWEFGCSVLEPRGLWDFFIFSERSKFSQLYLIEGVFYMESNSLVGKKNQSMFLAEKYSKKIEFLTLRVQ